VNFLPVTTKAGSNKFKVNLAYTLQAPQYENLEEVQPEAPDKASFEDVARVNLNAALKQNASQGNKGGVREALDTYLESLEASEIDVLREMSIEDRSDVLTQDDGVAKAIANHQEKCQLVRLSATVQRGRSDGLKQSEIDKGFHTASSLMSQDEIAATMEFIRQQRAS